MPGATPTSRGASSARRLAAILCSIAPIGLFAGAAPAGAAPYSPSAETAGGGTVTALFAGSLLDYMEHDLGPSFQKATGYGYSGIGGGSTEVAAEIKGGVRVGDVFISAAAAADQTLEGSANGNWVSWYSTFAASPLMLAYNPHSRFGAELAARQALVQGSHRTRHPGRTNRSQTRSEGHPHRRSRHERVAKAPRPGAAAGAELLPRLSRDCPCRSPAIRPTRRRVLLRGRGVDGKARDGEPAAGLQGGRLHGDRSEPRTQSNGRRCARELPAERASQLHAEEERADRIETDLLGQGLERAEESA